jgi:predicted ATPase
VTFAGLLKDLRRAAGLSQKQLADRVGYSVDYISMLERATREPSRASLRLLADALELDGLGRVKLERARFRPVLVLEQPGEPHAETLPIVGRATELAVLRDHLSGNGPPCLLVAGEPGIGKTRLLNWATEQAEQQHITVLRASGQRGGGPARFAPVVDALANFVQKQPRAKLERYLTGCTGLAYLLPELVDLGVAQPLRRQDGQKRRLAYRAVGRFLSNVAGRGGCLLVLDDLHWAGTDALELVGWLLRAESPVRVLGSYCDLDLSPRKPFFSFVSDLVRRDEARRLRVARLDAAQSEALTRNVLGEPTRVQQADVDRLVSRADGVPLFIVGLAQALRAGSVDRERVPWDLAHVIRERIGSLPTHAQDILRVAAVAGDMVSSGVLSTAVGQPEDAVLPVLETLCNTGFLVEEQQDHYRFGHGLILEVVEADLRATQRSTLRGRLKGLDR